MTRKLSLRGRRNVKNAVFATAEHALNPVLTLVATPVYLGALGVDQFGIWMLANSLLGFSGVFGFGLTDATIRYVVRYRSADDAGGVVRVVRTTWTLYGALGLLAGLVLAFGATTLVESVFRVPLDQRATAVLALQVAALGVFVRFMDSVLAAAIQGFERYDVTARISMITQAIGTGTAIVAALLGASLHQLMLVVVSAIGIAVFVRAWSLKRWFVPTMSLVPHLDGHTIREVASFGVYSWIQGIGGMLFAHLDRFLVAAIVGTAGLAYYTIPLQLAQQVHALLARGSGFVFPLASGAYERGDTIDLRRIYTSALRVIAALSVAAAVPLFVLAPSLLELWVGADVAEVSAPLLMALAVAISLYAAGIVPYYFMNATGLVRLNAGFGLLGGLIVAAASVVLIPTYGLIGAAAARFANLPVDVVARTILHNRSLADARWYTGFTPFLPAVTTFAVAVVVRQFVDVTASDLASALALAVVTAVAAGGVAFGVALLAIRTAESPPARPGDGDARIGHRGRS